MKLTKIFGIVLSLHVAVILLVMFQPSCQTFPNKGDGEGETSDKPSGDDPSAAFNSGLEEEPAVVPVDSTKVGGGGERFPPTSPKPGELLVPAEPETVSPIELRPSDVQVYKVQKGDSLWSIARKHNLTMDRLLSANDISKEATLSIGQEIFLPVAGGGGTPSTTPLITPEEPVPVSTGAEVHVVRRGDTLSGIAKNYGVSVNAIKDANNLRSDLIQIGQRLLVPGATVSPPPAPAVSPPPSTIPGQVRHVVKAGETLSAIARRYGVSLPLLADMNNLDDSGSLKVGQELIVRPAPISEDPTPAPVEDDPDSIENIFKNAGEAPVIPLPPKNE